MFASHVRAYNPLPWHWTMTKGSKQKHDLNSISKSRYIKWSAIVDLVLVPSKRVKKTNLTNKFKYSWIWLYFLQFQNMHYTKWSFLQKKKISQIIKTVVLRIVLDVQFYLFLPLCLNKSKLLCLSLSLLVSNQREQSKAVGMNCTSKWNAIFVRSYPKIGFRVKNDSCTFQFSEKNPAKPWRLTKSKDLRKGKKSISWLRTQDLNFFILNANWNSDIH